MRKADADEDEEDLLQMQVTRFLITLGVLVAFLMGQCQSVMTG